MSVNPLLNKYNILPAFSEIKPDHVEEAVSTAVKDYMEGVERILSENATYTWDNLIEPLMDLDDNMDIVIGPISHLISVNYSDELNDAFESTIDTRTDFNTWISNHTQLYEALCQIQQSNRYDMYSVSQKRVIDEHIKSFKDSGFDLPKSKKDQLAEYKRNLNILQSEFNKNSVNSISKGPIFHITDKSRLNGIPAYAVETAKLQAQNRNLDGWVFTLQAPQVSAIMNNAEDRSLRKEVIDAHMKKASELDTSFDNIDDTNTHIVDKIVDYKTKIAKLLGFKDHASRSTYFKMAKTPEKVLAFSNDIVKRVLPLAKKEHQELVQFIESEGLTDPQYYDFSYYITKMIEEHFSYNENELREYLVCDNVLDELFNVVHELYGITVEKGVTISSERNNVQLTRQNKYPVDVWDESVTFYRVYDEGGDHIASFYCDLFARETKRSGAWMNSYVSKRVYPDGNLTIPVAYINCNFNAPTSTTPSLLSMDDVETLFHEFGHGLHHMLTEVEYPSINGINNVAWDAVEVPSMFMEHFCWNKDSIKRMGKHYQTNQIIPDNLIDKVISSKTFRLPSMLLRQLQLGLFDMRLYTSEGKTTHDAYFEVKSELSVTPVQQHDRMYTTFGHIFSGGYSAGYYSYMWADIMSSDVFAQFEERNNILSRSMGLKFWSSILSQGGQRDFDELIQQFLGREPSIDNFLRFNNIE